MKFFEWQIEMEENFKAYMDVENKRIAILTAEDDEIHGTFEIDEDNNLIMHPRWNINIVFIKDKHIKLTSNSTEI